MKGIYTIEKIKRNGKTETFSIPNLISDYYKKDYNADNQIKTLVFPDSEWCPVVSGDSFNLPSDFIYRYVVYHSYHSWELYSWDSDVYNLPSYSLTRTGQELLQDGKHTYFETDYINGPFEICGLCVFWNLYWRGESYDYRSSNRLFSATNILEGFAVEENEKVKFKYELFQEWE